MSRAVSEQITNEIYGLEATLSYTIPDTTKKKDKQIHKQAMLDLLQSIFTNEYIDLHYLNLVEEAMQYNSWTWEEVFEQKEKYPMKKIWRIVSIRNAA